MRVAGAAAFGHWGRAPIYWHWTLFLGAVLFSGFALAPGRWIAFPLVVLAHEIGHAVLVRRYRLPVMALVIHGAGGECVHGGGSKVQRSVIAWGGVLGQLPLLVLAVAARVFHFVEPRFVTDLLYGLLWPNLILAGYNLLPVRGVDGAEAWQYWKRRRQQAMVPAQRRALSMALQLNDIDGRVAPPAVQADVAALLASLRKGR